MKHLLKLLAQYWLPAVALVVFAYAVVMANLWLPDKMSDIVNSGIIGQNLEAIWDNGWRMIAVTAVGGVCSAAAGFLASRIATGMARQLREKVFARIEKFSLADFNKFSTASLITRSTNDIQQIQMSTTMLLRIALMAPIMAIGGLQKALATAPDMSWIIALAVAVLLAVVVVLSAIAIPRFKKLQELVDKLNQAARENLTGLRVVRAFHNEKLEEKKFKKTNRELTELNSSKIGRASCRERV